LQQFLDRSDESGVLLDLRPPQVGKMKKIRYPMHKNWKMTIWQKFGEPTCGGRKSKKMKKVKMFPLTRLAAGASRNKIKYLKNNKWG